MEGGDGGVDVEGALVEVEAEAAEEVVLENCLIYPLPELYLTPLTILANVKSIYTCQITFVKWWVM